MAHGFTGTKDQLAQYAERFAASGLAVLTFDYRGFGESDGSPRQIVDIKEQLEDWRAAIRFARGRDGIDPGRIALWGCSLSGGHVINLGAEDPALAAIVAQVPAVDKSMKTMSREVRARMKSERMSPATATLVALKIAVAAVYDRVRELLGLSPYYLPVFGKAGEAAVFTDGKGGANMAFFQQAGPTWRNEFAPRFVFGMPRYRRGTAEKVTAPLLVCVAQFDTQVYPAAAAYVARKAPHGELQVYPANHFDVYSGAVFEQMVAVQIAFLQRHLVGGKARVTALAA
jgi:fermentation-respiration switch protein FrsA (DUF1100 family)